jgi:hypothetical protein
VITTQLPFGEVGYADGDTIYLDAGAAGFGWNLGTAAPVAGRMDLLTVVLHEIGHTVGLADGCSCGPYGDLMQATLPAGVRRLLPAAQLGPPSVHAHPKRRRATPTLRLPRLRLSRSFGSG